MATYGTLIPRGPGFMLAHHAGELLAKTWMNIVYYVRQAPFTVSPLSLLAFVAGFALAMRRPVSDENRARRALAEWTIAVAVVTVLNVAPIAAEPRYLAPVAPTMLVLGVGWAIGAAGATRRPAVVAIVSIALLALPLAASARDLARSHVARWHDPNLEAVAALTSRDDVIVSDIGRAVAWYTRRASVQTPIDRDTFERIDRELLPLSAVYLSATVRARWSAMYGARDFAADRYIPGGFVLVTRFPDGGALWGKVSRSSARSTAAP